ncbi:MAG UNVERIFIED_CONTAM: hypothetical protein LVR18_41185 [Planctomycetaceae bacterium]
MSIAGDPRISPGETKLVLTTSFPPDPSLSLLQNLRLRLSISQHTKL